MDNLPSEIEELANKAVVGLLPEKSKGIYEKTYANYETWCSQKKVVNIVHEKVLLAYFKEESMKKKSSSLWSYYSMLRSTLLIKKNVDISKFNQLIAFLKRKSDSYTSKKSRILTKENVAKFLQEADNETYLLLKVSMIIGISGACRRDELKNLRIEDVHDEGVVFRIFIPSTKTKVPREFFVTPGDVEGINMVQLVRTYVAMRPPDAEVSRFLLSFRNNKCTKQPVGIHTFGNMCKTIAAFLKLPHSAEYTGHCFRRSSASLLADSGVDLHTIKRHGGWKSDTVAEGYIENSCENKKRISAAILGKKSSSSVSSTVVPSEETETIQIKNHNNATISTPMSNINLTNCNNVTFNFNH